ncbi:hypothetical protein L1987_54764 [Smallanthus sonchifolius]|uniref:Uncharacterized protein n=1 Tax=Smallanthus sonchifolius TaxID=185202 RepID=A0ACB9E841_9ASTR|nr:hypothetical protein L1987_54764 [Smallanthus sonchifolius]
MLGTSAQQHVEPLPGQMIRLVGIHPEGVDLIPEASGLGRWIVLFVELGLKILPSGIEKPPPNLVELLVHSNLYDMVFTVILKFFKGSALKRELERVFIAMSLKCCPSRENSKKHTLLLTSSKDEAIHDSVDIAHHSIGNDQWEALEQYIEKYKCFHARLPVIVAETLLCADRLIELPLWLVQMFKVFSTLL